MCAHACANTHRPLGPDMSLLAAFIFFNYRFIIRERTLSHQKIYKMYEAIGSGIITPFYR